MCAGVAVEFKKWAEAGFTQHTVGIATYRKHLALLYSMMLIEGKDIFTVFDSALIANCLAIILTVAFQAWQFE